MSREGSDISQITQFGIYRSIDERTEKFLRQSRTRQIRQGCACAAISTIVTITVVITIILIYEYNAISDTDTNTALKPNWLKLMNSSANDAPFEVKLDQSKISFDPATIKILPLILKTLKKNKYFDRSIEDTSSLTSTNKFETKDIYKNIFSDTRNWMKIPTSRFYAIEYKTSPIVYFKNPTRNIDYFTKVRKIRDYQRIMNYVDKMISERVTLGSTMPLTKNVYSISKNSAFMEYTTPMSKITHLETKPEKLQTMVIKNISSDKKPECKCPKRMNELLKKIISNLQNLLPSLGENSSHVQKPCSYNNSITTKITNVLKSQMESISQSYETSTKRLESTTSSMTGPYKSEKVKKLHSITSYIPKLDYTLNNIIELLKPNLINRRIVKDNNRILNKTPTNYFFGATQKNKNNYVSILPASAIAVGDYILQRNLNKKTTPVSSAVTPAVTDKEYYKDYIETTPINYHTNDYNKNNYKVLSNIKIGSSTDSYHIKSSPEILSETTEPIYSTISSNIDNNSISSREFNNSNISSKTKISTNINKNFISTSTNNPLLDTFKFEQTLKSEDITLEEELKKTTNDDVSPEESIKHLEGIIKTLNSSEINKNNTSGLYEWELVNVEDYSNNLNIVNSMIAQNKASYLEIQRNDWKLEENQDYDNNMNNYYLE